MNPNDDPRVSSEQQRAFLKACSWSQMASFCSDQQKGLPSGPVETPLPDTAERITLPAAKTLTCGRIPLGQVIAQRRSRRAYANQPLTLAELAYLCWATLGIQKVFGSGKAVYRTVPSAGARHALQLYIAVGNVEGLTNGLYRYAAVDHELALLASDETIMEKTAQACLGQHWIAQAAAALILTAVPYRMEWRYGPVSPKLIALDAGHACQNAYLAAESIQAGACAIAAYDQTQIDDLLGLDGNEEFVIYLAPVGKV